MSKMFEDTDSPPSRASRVTWARSPAKLQKHHLAQALQGKRTMSCIGLRCYLTMEVICLQHLSRIGMFAPS